MRFMLVLLMAFAVYPAHAMSEKARIEAIAVAHAIAGRCSYLSLNMDIAGVMIDHISLDRETTYAIRADAGEKARSALSGVTDEVVCLTGERMFGPGGETVENLLHQR